MKTKSYVQTMSDGCEIFVNRWMPDDEQEIKGVIQLNHGLSEHSLRYDRLGSILAENGYVFNAHDVRGHGKTGENAESKGTGLVGKLANKCGSKKVVEDLHELIEGLKKEYPDKKVILIGHSFGSFVSQGYIEKYSQEIDGCVLCGTAGPRPFMIDAGKVLSSIARLFCGNKPARFLALVAFGSYNSHIKNPKTQKDWLSRDELNVQMNGMDKWCNIPLRVSFFDDMMSLLCRIHKSKNMKNISNELPVYMIYGSEDPVGDYGKTIQKLYKIYLKNGMKNVQIKSYKDDRHEIFNETDKELVEKDLISWINQHI